MYTRFYTEDDTLAARARFNILARVPDELRLELKQLHIARLLETLTPKRRRKVKKK